MNNLQSLTNADRAPEDVFYAIHALTGYEGDRQMLFFILKNAIECSPIGAENILRGLFDMTLPRNWYADISGKPMNMVIIAYLRDCVKFCHQIEDILNPANDVPLWITDRIKKNQRKVRRIHCNALDMIKEWESCHDEIEKEISVWQDCQLGTPGANEFEIDPEVDGRDLGCERVYVFKLGTRS